MNATLFRPMARAAICAMLVASGVSQTGLASPFVPAACKTKTEIFPPTSGWAFVVNFEAFTTSAGTDPQGCLVVWRVPRFRPTDYVVSDCVTHGPTGGVQYISGTARFAGGHITCDFNVRQSLAALTPTIVISNVELYPYFTLIGVGALNNRQNGAVNEHPIAHYQPDKADEPVASLYVSTSPNGGRFASVANGITQTGRFLNELELAPRTPYTFAVVYDGISDSLTTTHYLGVNAIDTFTNTPPVRIWTDGGAFWIGATPSNPAPQLDGVFDEVILDPPDGGAPPPPLARSVRYFDIWLPWMGLGANN